RTRLDGQLLEVRAVLVALRQPEPLLVGEGAVVGDRLVVHVRAVLVVGADRVRVPELVVDVLALDAALAEVDQRAVARHLLQPLRVHLGDAGGGLRGRARRRLGGRALVGRLRRRRGRCGRGGGGGRGRGRRGRRRLGRARRGGAAGRRGATGARRGGRRRRCAAAGRQRRGARGERDRLQELATVRGAQSHGSRSSLAVRGHHTRGRLARPPPR